MSSYLGLPPSANATISVVNSSSTNLASAATFTGGWEATLNYPSLVVACITDQAGTLYVDFSDSGASAQSTTTANIFFVMQIGLNQTNSSAYTVPAGKTAYLQKLSGSIRGGATAVVDGGIWTRSFGGVFRQRRPFTMSSSLVYRDDIFGGLVFTEKSDIIIRLTVATTNNLDVVAGYDLLLIDN